MRTLGLTLLCLPVIAHAGAQQYEPLAASVRARLSAAIADKAVPVLNFRSAADANRWLQAMEDRLARRIPDRQQRLQLLRTVHYEATRAGLDPQLVLGVLEVESGFRKYAVSRAGARGYMQVMPFWSDLIGSTEHNLFHLRTNLRYGCVILRHYLDIERGNLTRALARYNGSLGKKGNYAAKVTAAWERWAWPAPQVTRVAHPRGPMQYAGEAK